MSLWTSSEAAAATGGNATADWLAKGVSIDTRTLQEGELFVALKAARDGHDFVAQALEKGAAAALVSHVPDGVASDAPLLIVDDVLQGLEALGKAARARTHARVVGVTGSVGKTSTKEMLRIVLGGQGKVHAAEASYNNHWGVPLTLARMPADTDFAVIEIGMNAPGEIAPLSKMARPHVAMVTTVAAVHLEAFDDIQGIAAEKASIFEGLEPNGVAIINGDIETVQVLDDAAKKFATKFTHFGQSDGCCVRASGVQIIDQTTLIQFAIRGQDMLMKIAAPGRHFAQNALGVMAVADALGLDPAIALSDIATWAPPAGRGTRERIAMDVVEDHLYFDLIDDAFNANPTSMAASLEVLAAAQVPDGARRVAVLGDMLELGPNEMAMHHDLIDLPSMSDLDVVHCVGPRMKALYDALPEYRKGRWVDSAAELVPFARNLVHAGDVLLVKGSKGSKVSTIVDAVRKLGHSAAIQKNEDA